MKILQKLKKKVSQYPRNFSLFAKDDIIEDSSIRWMLNDLAETMEKNEYGYIASGSKIVIGLRQNSEMEDGKYQVSFIVCKEYEEIVVDGLDFDDIQNMNGASKFFDK